MNRSRIELRLFHDRRHVAVQPGAVLGGDLLGGDHQDRDPRGVRLLVERLHDVEAVRRPASSDRARSGPAARGARSRSPRGRRRRAARCWPGPCMRTAISSTAFGSSSTTRTFSAWPCDSGNRPRSTSDSYSSCREIGFCMTAAAPSAKPLLRSATIEMITTGMRRSSGTCLRRLRNSQPSMLGSMMSSVISDSGCCTASTSAASAEAACSTVKPSASSCTRIRSADLKSSSTTSAVRAPGRRPRRAERPR